VFGWSLLVGSGLYHASCCMRTLIESSGHALFGGSEFSVESVAADT